MRDQLAARSIVEVVDTKLNDVKGLDGVSHWSAMQTDWSSTRPNTRRMVASPRDLMVYNIDDELITEIFNVQNRTGKFQVPSDFSIFLKKT